MKPIPQTQPNKEEEEPNDENRAESNAMKMKMTMVRTSPNLITISNPIPQNPPHSNPHLT